MRISLSSGLPTDHRCTSAPVGEPRWLRSTQQSSSIGTAGSKRPSRRIRKSWCAAGPPRRLHLFGAMRQKQARHEDALELIGLAIRVRPGVAVYHNNYGAALLSRSRFAEAEASIGRAGNRRDYANCAGGPRSGPGVAGRRRGSGDQSSARLWLSSRDTLTRRGDWPRWSGIWGWTTRRFASTRKHCRIVRPRCSAVPFSKLRVFAAAERHATAIAAVRQHVG